MDPAADARARVSSRLSERLLGSPWLRRLGRISFLGTLDDHPKSRARSDRLVHSIAVAGLADRAARDLELDDSRAKHLVAAALLHDVGHFPFSHAAEPAFRTVLGTDHHGVTEWIVRGIGAFEHSGGLRPALAQLELDPDLVWRLIDGAANLPSSYRPLKSLLSGSITFDTLDGITRVARDFGLRSPAIAGPRRLLCWHDDQAAIRPDAVPLIDKFWQAKERIYSKVIESPANLAAEARLAHAVLQWNPQDAFSRWLEFDDETMMIALASSWDAIRLRPEEEGRFVLASKTDARPLLVRHRKRYIVHEAEWDAGAALPSPQWKRRYAHHKERATLVFAKPQLSLPWQGADTDPMHTTSPEI